MSPHPAGPEADGLPARQRRRRLTAPGGGGPGTGEQSIAQGLEATAEDAKRGPPVRRAVLVVVAVVEGVEDVEGLGDGGVGGAGIRG